MKISVNDEELFTLSEIQKQVIKNDIPEDIFEQDMKRRLFGILDHKYQQCLKRLKEEWMPKLMKKGVNIFSLNDYDFAVLVFSQDDYVDRKARDLESIL